MEDLDVRLTETEISVLDRVDEVVSSAVTAGDPVPAFGFAMELIRAGQVRGLALAKLFYKIKSSWSLFERAGIEDNFEDFASAHTGRSVQTIVKYARMWENIFENPEISDLNKKMLMGRDIGNLLLLTAVARENPGEPLTEVIEAQDVNTMRDKIKKIRGDRTSSSSAVRLFIHMRDGSTYPSGAITVKRGDQVELIGSLDVTSTDELVKKAIDRIISSSGMVEVQ